MIIVDTAQVGLTADRESEEMLEMYAAGSFAVDATDPGNAFNARAMQQSRLVSELREFAAQCHVRTSLASRLRAVMLGRGATASAQGCASA